MDYKKIQEIVYGVINEYCQEHGIEAEINEYTPLIGSSKIMDSISDI